MGAKIQAIDYYFPEKKVTNQDLGREFPDYDFSKFEYKIGISSRYVAAPNETALDLAEKACLKLFGRIDKNQIDYVLYCTQSPEYIMPSTACILQDRLGLNKTVGAFDFNLGCSGYTYGLSMAKAFIESGQAKNILLVTTDTYSKYINKKDRSNRAIFGDAATATLVSFAEKNGIYKFRFGTDGGGFNKLIVKNGAGRYPHDNEAVEHIYGRGNIYTENNLYMNGPEIFRFTSTVVPPFIEEVLKFNDVEKKDIGQFVFHQANAHMLKVMRERLFLPIAKFYINLRDGGNTVSSTIPIALKNYSNQDMNVDETAVIIAGFGVGLSWSAGLIDISRGL
ncbi:ketoacyl-ACP synthase III [Olivibacter sp. SDN3]|uniref:ketoacyl-ACP synthase III n=1 Tax=Olivibacter sp. SDN3 TaxID=2764720 RepID=UPI00165109F3|nr:ketoacyl-ACP synthase III [Olivibacter sp. SDN3]QNL52098.1 ketoacyl-ACP synthase III [Olivibacter sp. SDN3]